MGRLDGVGLHMVETTEDIEEFKRWLGQKRDVLGFDTETSGFSPEHDRIRLIQFGDMTAGYAIDWQMWRGLAHEVLTRYDGPLVAHNSKFDVRHICHDFGWSVEKWPWHRTHDTQGMAHILDSQRLKGLKPLANYHVDGRAAAGQSTLDDAMKRNGWDWGTVPVDFPPYWQYAALDPVLTAHMYDVFKDEVFGQHKELYDMEMGAIRVAAKMEERGARVDLGYSRTKAVELREYEIQARAYLRSQYGIDNPTSMQLIRFFQANDIPMIDKMTASGGQLMDVDVLNAIDHEVAKITLAIRKANKMAGTYLENFSKFADDEGFLHPSINTMAARTGRMSITDPALQTLPRKDPLIRDAFIPRPQHSLLTIDADQIEARLTAHFSRDPGLIAAFHEEGDFFCNIGAQIFQRPIKKGDPERDLVKPVVYGKVYGSSVAKMAATAGVMQSQMHAVNATFDARFPGVRRMMMEIVDTGKKRKLEEGRGYVITPYGRKLRSDPGKEYTLVNYLIQCHASEILKKKMVLLDQAIPEEALMILPVHDEIIFDVPTDMVHDVKRVAEEVLNESEGYLVPITWSGDILSESWGEKYRK